MDLLAGYDGASSSDVEEQPQQGQQQPAIKLPPPKFDDNDMGGGEDAEMDTSVNPLKRSYQQVSGSSLIGPANKGAAKTQKPSSSTAAQASNNTAGERARATSNPNLLLPPQLKGRPNVATEDVGKLFTQSNLQVMRSSKVQLQKAQIESGSPRHTAAGNAIEQNARS